MSRPFFYRETEGIRISVRPVYLPDRSHPVQQQFVFAYHVRIENVGPVAVQLLTRRWLIFDSVAGETTVEGDGVLGQQPRLEPGEVHEYQSFYVLKSPHGHMEGQYRFVRPDGTSFAAEIPRFMLEANQSAEPQH